MEGLFGLFVLMLLAVGTAGLLIALHEWLGPKRSSQVRNMPFECGREPKQIIRGKFSVKFFVVALLFILFDVELIFLFPWAIVYRDLGLFGFVEMFIFLLVVLAGLWYSVRRGALEWK